MSRLLRQSECAPLEWSPESKAVYRSSSGTIRYEYQSLIQVLAKFDFVSPTIKDRMEFVCQELILVFSNQHQKQWQKPILSIQDGSKFARMVKWLFLVFCAWLRRLERQTWIKLTYHRRCCTLNFNAGYVNICGVVIKISTKSARTMCVFEQDSSFAGGCIIKLLNLMRDLRTRTFKPR